MTTKSDYSKIKVQESIKSLVFTVVGSFAVLVSVIVCIVFWFLSSANNDEENAGYSELNKVANTFETFLTETQNSCEVVSQGVERLIWAKRTDAINEFLHEKNAYYISYFRESSLKGGFYAFVDGKLYNGGGSIDKEIENVEEKSWYKYARAANGSAVLTINEVGREKTLVLCASKQLQDKKSVVAFEVYLDDFRERLKDVAIGENVWGVIISRTGKIVAEFGDKNVPFLRDEYDFLDNLRILMGTVQRGGSGYINMEMVGEECNIFHKCVKNDYFAVLIFHKNELFRRVRTKLFLKILIVLTEITLLFVGYAENIMRRRKLAAYTQLLEENRAVLAEYHDKLENKLKEQTQVIESQTHELIKMQENIIENLATMIESRDECTGEHVRNTKVYAVLLSKYLFENHLFPEEIDEDFITLMGDASLMHDIGKIKISDTILNKTDALTKEEFEIMKMHTVFGREIAGKILAESKNRRLIEMAENVANYHHERFDGQGYPDGLIGNEIPLCARIMAVVDVFDALVSKRSYKFSIKSASAFDIIAHESGTHFDPVLVDAFLKIRPQIEAFHHDN